MLGSPLYSLIKLHSYITSQVAEVLLLTTVSNTLKPK
jgi:hypothetical protein